MGDYGWPARGPEDGWQAHQPPARRSPAWPAPPRRRSFLQRHWQAIAVAGLTAVMVAAADTVVPGGLAGIKGVLTEWQDPDLDPAALGSWRFDRFDPGQPQVLMTGVTYQFNTLQLFEDGRATASVTISNANVGLVQEANGSGSYEMVDGDTLRLEGSGLDGQFSVFDVGVVGGELRLSDSATGSTHVFRRLR